MAVLKALVNGAWVPVGGGSGGGTGSDEVFIQPDDPITLNPTAELWYDTDAVTPAANPVAEIFYSELLADVTITSTTASAPTMVLNPGSVVYDGSPIIVEFYTCALCPPNTINNQIVLNLYDGNTDLGYIAQCFNPGNANMQVPTLVRRRLTPTAGAHSYNIRAWVSGGGNGAIRGGPGNTALNFNPGFLRATRVLQGGGTIAPPQSGLDANRPAAAAKYAGLRYFATDTLRDWLCDGIGWIIMAEPYQLWTPSILNITLGNGTLAGFSKRGDGWCDFYGSFVLNTTGNITGDARIAVPYPALHDNNANYRAHVLQYGANEHPCLIGINTASTFAPRAINTATATATQAVFTATVPFTWLGSQAMLYFSGRYAMASRYS